MPRCQPPKCVNNPRRNTCEKPNAWNAFRRMNSGLGASLSEMSRRYQAFKSAHPDKDWCPEATHLYLERRTVLPREPEEGVPPPTPDTARDKRYCRELVAALTARPHVPHQFLVDRWEAAERIVRRRYRGNIPDKAQEYPEELMNLIADVISDAFFGPEYVRVIRRRFNWYIRMHFDEVELTEMVGAAYTGQNSKRNPQTKKFEYNFGTRVSGNLIDAYLIPNDPTLDVVSNDSFLIRNRLRWVMHVVGHEMLHVFQMKVCKDNLESDNHGQLNAGHRTVPFRDTHSSV